VSLIEGFGGQLIGGATDDPGSQRGDVAVVDRGGEYEIYECSTHDGRKSTLRSAEEARG